MNNIGKTTRCEEIAKWRDKVKKNTDLLLAFTVDPIEDEPLAKFRSEVADRIKSLADYLANGEWGLLDGLPMTEPPSKAEREAFAEEAAERAAAEDAARQAEAEKTIDVAASASPLALPPPPCHYCKNGACENDNGKVVKFAKCENPSACPFYDPEATITEADFKAAKDDIERRKAEKKNAKKSGKKSKKDKKPDNPKDCEWCRDGRCWCGADNEEETTGCEGARFDDQGNDCADYKPKSDENGGAE